MAGSVMGFASQPVAHGDIAGEKAEQSDAKGEIEDVEHGRGSGQDPVEIGLSPQDFDWEGGDRP
jgi:hypothetical protein